MLKKSVVAVLLTAFSLCAAGCQKKTVQYTGTVAQLNEYEGNYSILVNVDKNIFSDDCLTIGLTEGTELLDSSGNAAAPQDLVCGSEIAFTVIEDYEMLLCYPPILKGCTRIVLQ